MCDRDRRHWKAVARYIAKAREEARFRREVLAPWLRDVHFAEGMDLDPGRLTVRPRVDRSLYRAALRRGLL